ncbi:unnamed protein product, partial [Symbiodinium sp. KB8]
VEWLQKTAEEIRQFGVDEVRDWVQAMLPKNPGVAETLDQQQVDGEALLELTSDDMKEMGILLTFERLVDKPYNIVAGPAEVLAKRIAAVSAPPMAASGFQDDPDATEFIRELAKAMPTDLGEGQCVYVEAFSWAEVEACCPHFKTQVEKEEMLRRFQQVGGAVRTLLADEEIYNEAVEQQEIEANDFTTVQRAFADDLYAIDKKMPTRLFTYRSVDGIKREVKICSPGVATLLVKKHYDKLVGLWKDADDPKSRHGLEDCVGPLLTTFWPGKQGLTAFELTNASSPTAKKAQWKRERVDDLEVKENLTLLES